jgi:hypothetical protein
VRTREREQLRERALEAFVHGSATLLPSAVLHMEDAAAEAIVWAALALMRVVQLGGDGAVERAMAIVRESQAERAERASSELEKPEVPDPKP